MSVNNTNDTKKPMQAKDFAPPAPDDNSAKVIDELNNKIKDLQEKCEQEKAEQIRLVAELRNQKDRLDRLRKMEVERAGRYVITDLLSSLDGLEKALEAAGQENATIEGIVNGVKMTQTEIEKTLVKHGVEIIRPIGEMFDPELHEALAMASAPDAESNSIISVIQTGYKLGTMLVRPAKVIVCQNKNDESAS